MLKKKVIVIGGGAAGMMAAIAAAQNGHQVVLLEKNEKLGKKIYITGKGRCNVTNACDREDFFGALIHNPKFMYSSFDTCSNMMVYGLLEEWGVPLKVERGDRVFPQSDKSSDIITAMANELHRLGVEVKLRHTVKKLQLQMIEDKLTCTGVVLQDGTKLSAQAVIVATGGLSYPSTGSTGDGYRFAKACDMSVIPLRPALVPFQAKEAFCKELQGISLKNVSVTLWDGKKLLYEGFGEMLFTHFGVSGPLILSASSYATGVWNEGVQGEKDGGARNKKTLFLLIDLKPALSGEQLDARLIREIQQNPQMQFKNITASFLPKRLLDVVIAQSGVDGQKKGSEITRAERDAFCTVLKALPITITGTRDYLEAIITQGGVSVKEISPTTMESKKVAHLHFAGEVLDVDALTGGFNLQVAWSTGYAAGSAI